MPTTPAAFGALEFVPGLPGPSELVAAAALATACLVFAEITCKQIINQPAMMLVAEQVRSPVPGFLALDGRTPGRQRQPSAWPHMTAEQTDPHLGPSLASNAPAPQQSQLENVRKHDELGVRCPLDLL